MEYTAWLAFYEVEPFGDVRADLRAGIVSALIARTMGGRRDASPLDYMPIVEADRQEREKEMTQRERNAAMRQVFEGNLGSMRVRKVKIRNARGASDGKRRAR